MTETGQNTQTPRHTSTLTPKHPHTTSVSIHPTAGPKQPHTLSTLNYAGSSVSVRKPQAANLGLLCHWPPCSLKETHAARFHHPLPTVLKEPSWKTMPSFTSDLLHGSLDVSHRLIVARFRGRSRRAWGKHCHQQITNSQATVCNRG